MDNFNTRAIQTEFYGDTWRWWVGVVVDNNDPLQAGRLRVRIYGVHSGDLNLVPMESLPWAIPVIPTTEDGVSGLGRSSKLKPGAMVTGYFADGMQSQLPIIIGSLPRFAEPTPGQLGEGSRWPSSSTAATENAPRSKETNDTAKGLPGYYPTAGAVGANNTEKAFNFFITTGMTPVQSAAVCGNLIKQSNIDPEAKKGMEGEQSYGIAQWPTTGNRKEIMMDFASERGLSHKKLETQLQFLMYDFAELNPRYYQYSTFQSSSTVPKATEVFSNYYLRTEVNDLDERIQLAKDVFEAYTKA